MRSLIPLLLICGTVCGVSVSRHLVATPLGGVVTVDESRTTSLQATVKVDKSLFAINDNRIPTYDATEVETKVQNLLTNTHKRCAKDLGLVANEAVPLPLSTFVHESNEGMKEQDSLEKVYNKYLAIFRELYLLKNTQLHALEQPTIAKAIRKVVQNYTKNLPEDEQILISLVGCTSEDALVLQVTLPYVAEAEAVKFYEVVDYGRFDESRVAYVRIDIAKHWIQTVDGHSKWATVDIAQCEQKHETLWSCPREAVLPTTHCTPQNVDGCPAKVTFVKDNAVYHFHLTNGSVVIASNLEKFNIMRQGSDSGSENMPSSGVIVANASMHCNFKLGNVKVRGHNATADCGWSPARTTSISFEDSRFVEEDYERSGWAFVIVEKEQGMSLKAIPVGFFYDVFNFVQDNVWWLAALTAAVVLSIAITLLFVCCRVRMAAAYQQIQTRLPKASDKCEKAKPTDENIESGADMSVEEFDAERKRRRFPQLHFPQFNLGFGKSATQVPTTDDTDATTIEQSKQQRDRLMRLLKNLNPRGFLKSKSTSEGSECDSTSEEELSSVKVVDAEPEGYSIPEITNDMDVFAYANILSQLNTSEEKLNELRLQLTQRQKSKPVVPEKPMCMNLVAFWKLVKYGTEITEDNNNEMPPSGLPREEAHRLNYALKALLLQTAVKPNKIYRFHHFVNKFPDTFIISDQQIGQDLTAKDYYRTKYGLNLRYPTLPMVSVNSNRGHCEHFPMELLEVRDDKELIFNSILLARNYVGKPPNAPRNPTSTPLTQ